MFRGRLFTKFSSQNITGLIRRNKINFFGITILFIVFISIILTANYYSLTGMYLLDQKEALDSPITVNSTSFLEFELEGAPESLSLSGYLLGEGTVRVYLANLGSLVMDSSHLSSKEFKDICEEACILEGVSSKIKLFVEIEDGDTSIILESLDYTSKNHVPVWTGKTNFVVSPGNSITIDLRLFVEDVDEDELVYSATSNKDIDVSVSSSKLTITPKPGFNGTTRLTVVVSDMIETLRQDILIEVIPVSDREALLVNSPLTIDKELFDEIEISGSSDVIVLLKDKYKSMQAREELVKDDIQKFKKGLDLGDKNEFGITVESDGEINKEYSNLKAISLKVTGSGFEKLKQNPDVAGIYKDKKLKIALQDSISLIKADEMNSFIPSNGSSISVCVLDTGIDYKHELFADSIAGGYNFVSRGDYALDDNNHGTHVSGIIKRVAPESKIVPVKVCNDKGECKASDILAGLDYCIGKKDELNIKVISGSLGDGLEHSPDCYGVFDSALEQAVQYKLIPIFASGNEGYKNGINYPACSQYTISVGSTTKNNTISSFTNLPVDVLAPGENINSSIIGGYGFMSGTSMAAAHAAGITAVLKQSSDLFDKEKVENLLVASSVSIDNYPVLDGADICTALNGDESGGIFSIAATEISSCGTTISDSGDYEITAYLSTSGTSDCITIGTNDIMVDCLGNHVVSTGTGEAFSSTTLRNNITIKNCFISGFNYGIYSDLHNLTVLNTTFNGTKLYGIFLSPGGQANISYNTFKYMPSTSSYAIYTAGAASINNYIINNTFVENKKHAVYIGSTNHFLYDNYIDMANSSSGYVFNVVNDFNTFHNNTIVNLGSSAYGFYGTYVRNTLDGNNFINGTNVSERWLYGKDNIVLNDVNWTEPNYFSMAQFIAVDGYNLTINRSSFSGHSMALYIEGINTTLIHESNISASSYNIEVEEGYNTTIRGCDLRDAGTVSILLDTSNYTYVYDSNISSVGGKGLATDNPLERIYLFNNFFNSTTGDAIVIGEAGSGFYYPTDFANITGNTVITTGTNAQGIDIQAIHETLGSAQVSYNNVTTTSDGIRINEDVPNVRIDFNNITGVSATTGSGIVCYGCINNIFVDNNISLFQYGIEVGLGSISSTNPVGNNFSNNNITDSIEYGIYFTTASSSVSTTMKNYVAENNINGVKRQYHYWTYDNVSITDFELVQNKTLYPGIIIIVDSRNINVTNMNISSNSTAAGLWLVNVTNAIIKNNTFKNNSDGIGLQSDQSNAASSIVNTTIKNNKFYGITNYGIYEDTDGYGINLTVFNNSLLWGGGTGSRGIYVVTAATRSGWHNISFNNISYGWGYGIFDNGLDYNIISSNYFFDIVYSGIYFLGENNTIRNNTIIKVDGQTTSAGITIQASAAKYNVIEYNHIENCSRGIDWASSGANNSAYNNTIYNCSQSGLYINPGTAQQRIYQNILCHNKNIYFPTGTKNISSVDFRNNYFCIEHLFPQNYTAVPVPKPFVSFNITNLFNRSSTNCTAYVDGDANGENTTLGIEHDNQTIQITNTILYGLHTYNVSCQDDYSNTALANSITMNSTFRENTSLLGVKFSVSDFSFANSNYVPGIIEGFNTSLPNVSLILISSFNVEKLSGGGTNTIWARVKLNNAVVREEIVRTVQNINDIGSTGISPVYISVTNGEHNLTIEFKRDGNGAVNITNMDLNLGRVVSTHNISVRSNLLNGTYAHTGNKFVSALNWTINKTLASPTATIIKQRISGTSAPGSIGSYFYQNLNTKTNSSYWKRYLSSTSDIGRLSGVFIESLDENKHNHSLMSNASTGTITVDYTLVDFDLRDNNSNLINNFNIGNNLTNITASRSYSAGLHNLANKTVTIRNGTGYFLVMSTSMSSSSGAQTPRYFINTSNVSQSTCFSQKERYLSSNSDIGNAYIYTICNNLIVGNDYLFNLWLEVETGETLIQYDESFGGFEVSAFGVEEGASPPIPNEITAPARNSLQTEMINKNITWSAFIDQNNNLNFYNITLRSNDYSLHAIINANTSNLFTPINYSNYGKGDYIMMVEACDTTGLCSNSTRNFTIDRLPVHTTPLINSSDGLNNTLSNISVYNQSTFDTDNDTIKNIYNWYRNGTSITVLNMPFEAWGKNTTHDENNISRDYSPYQNNGTVFSAVWNSTGGYDSKGAYQFDGGDDYIDFGNDTSLDFQNNSFTIVFWFKSNFAGESIQQIMTKNFGDITSDPGFILENTGDVNGALLFAVSNGSSLVVAQGTTALKDGAWHHIAAVRQGVYNIIYIDGDHETNSTGALLNISTTSHFMIGKYETGLDYLDGTIDELVIYNRSLSSAQIFALYENKTNTIMSEEIALDDRWYAQVTPNDGVADGQALASVNMTILNAGIECGLVASDTTMNQNLSAASTCFTITADSVTLDCAGYYLIGPGSSIGINFSNKSSITVKDCFIQNWSTGIYFNYSAGIDLFNNTFNNSQYNILIRDSNNTQIINNTLYTMNSSSIVGIEIEANTGAVKGFNLTNNMMAMSNNARPNLVNYNGITLISSDYFIDNMRILNNNISTQGTGLSSNVMNNTLIANNTFAGLINTSASFSIISLSGYGNNASEIYIRNNTVYSQYGNYANSNVGAKAISIGRKAEAYNNTIHDVWIGFEILQNQKNCLMQNNTVTNLYQSGTNKGRGFYFFSNTDANATIQNNVVSQTGQTDVWISSANGINIIDSIVKDYVISSGGVIVKNSTKGELKFAGSRIIQNGTDLFGSSSSDIRILDNHIFVNNAKTGFNISANLTLYNIYNTTPMPFVDLEEDGAYIYCNSTICTNISYADNNTFVFNVTHFTSFKVEENVPPSVFPPAITLPPPYYSDEDITATVAYLDEEGDTGTVYFRWYRDNAVIFTETETSVLNGTNATSTLAYNLLLSGSIVILEVWASDGSANSSAVNSSDLRIESRPITDYPGVGGGGSAAPVYYTPVFGQVSGDVFQLFDIIILYADIPVEAGDFLDFTYFIKAMTPLSDDVEISYWLESIDTKEKIVEGSSVIYFGDYEGKTLDSRLYIPKNLEGLYQLYVQAQYKDTRVKAKTPAEVVEQAPPRLDLIFLDKEYKQTENSVAFSFISKSNKDSALPVMIKETLTRESDIVWQNVRNTMLEKAQRYDEQVVNVLPDDYKLKISLFYNNIEQANIIRDISIRAPIIERPQPVGPKLILPALIFLILLAVIGGLLFLVPIIREVKFERKFPMLRRPVFFTRKPVMLHKRLEKKIDRSNKRIYDKLVSFSKELRMSKINLSGEFDKRIDKLNQKIHSQFKESRLEKELAHAREKLTEDIEQIERRHHKKHRK